MVLSLTLPQVGKAATTKDYIMTILGYDWPLTAKKIHNLIKKKYGYSATYQAVYKTINGLLKDGVVEKNDKGYQLNLKWLKDLHRYTEVIETNYYTKNRLNLIEGIKEARAEGNINVLTFETLFDVEKYLYYLQKQFIHSANGKEVICVHHNHEWRPLFYLRAEYNWQKKLDGLGHRTYVLCRGNSESDRKSAEFYKGLGCKIKTNVNCASTNELMVFDDFVIQVFLPHEIKARMDELLVGVVDHALLIKEIFEKKAEIQVIINKDRNIAEQIRKETLGYF